MERERRSVWVVEQQLFSDSSWEPADTFLLRKNALWAVRRYRKEYPRLKYRVVRYDAAK